MSLKTSTTGSLSTIVPREPKRRLESKNRKSGDNRVETLRLIE